MSRINYFSQVLAQALRTVCTGVSFHLFPNGRGIQEGPGYLHMEATASDSTVAQSHFLLHTPLPRSEGLYLVSTAETTVFPCVAEVTSDWACLANVLQGQQKWHWYEPGQQLSECGGRAGETKHLLKLAMCPVLHRDLSLWQYCM